MYAIVRAGGRQEKVSLGDTLEVDHVEGKPGDKVALAPLLVVDGSAVTSNAQDLQRWPVAAEIVDQTRGPKITILKFKNKTGYRKRQGFRSHLTQLRVVSIGEQKLAKRKATPAEQSSAQDVKPQETEQPKAQPAKAAAKKTSTSKVTKESSSSTTDSAGE